MSMWEILPDGNVCRSFHIIDRSPGEIIDMKAHFRSGQTVGRAWTPWHVELFEGEDEDKKPIGNFPSLGGSVPLAISAQALEVLNTLIKDNVEVLDLMTHVGKFYALNVFTSNCLDHSRSVFERFSDGGIMRVDKYAFRPGTLKGKHIFRIPEVWSHTFVDDVFKQAVEKNRLKGLLFYPIPEVDTAE